MFIYLQFSKISSKSNRRFLFMIEAAAIFQVHTSDLVRFLVGCICVKLQGTNSTYPDLFTNIRFVESSSTNSRCYSSTVKECVGVNRIKYSVL